MIATVTLAEFLSLRLAEDEALARRVSFVLAESEAGELSNRMLAQCEAKRRIMVAHQTWGEAHRNDPLSWPPDYPEGVGQCVTCGYGDEWQARDFEPSWYPCDTLRLLALPYASHPDYQEAWRP